MDFKNIEKIRYDVFEKIKTVDKNILEKYYKELSILTDLSDKSYDNKEITSPFITIINNTYVVEYFLNKYKVDKKIWLEFLLSINTIVGRLDYVDIDVLITRIDKISEDFYTKIIPIENICDKEFIQKIEAKVRDDIWDYELVTTIFSELIYWIMQQNIISKGLILDIIIDWIKEWQDLNDIVFRINNLQLQNE